VPVPPHDALKPRRSRQSARALSDNPGSQACTPVETSTGGRGTQAVLVGLGVLTNAAAAANDVVERKVDQGAIQVGRVGLESTTSGL